MTFTAHYEHLDGTHSTQTIHAAGVKRAYELAQQQCPADAFVRGVEPTN